MKQKQASGEKKEAEASGEKKQALTAPEILAKVTVLILNI